MRIKLFTILLVVSVGITAVGRCDFINDSGQMVKTKSQSFYKTDADWVHCDWEQNKASWYARYKAQGEDYGNPNLVEASWVLQALDGYDQNAISQYPGDMAIYKKWQDDRQTLLNKVEKDNDALMGDPKSIPPDVVKHDLIALFKNITDVQGVLGNSDEAMIIIMSLCRYDLARVLWNCSTHKRLDRFYEFSAKFKKLCDAKDYVGLKKFIRKTYVDNKIIPIGTWELVSNPPPIAGE